MDLQAIQSELQEIEAHFANVPALILNRPYRRIHRTVKHNPPHANRYFLRTTCLLSLQKDAPHLCVSRPASHFL
jgi:hypothetical protein